MSENHNFHNNLKECVNTLQSSSGLVNFATSMQYAERKDLLQILEFLHITQDMKTQVKLFSILAAYLISNGTHGDVIIKFNSIYDKIRAVLSRGLPQKTNVTLSFITALLYSEGEEATSRRKTLVAYAQNMLRTSGCLVAMVNLFASCMMQQETWRALCQCLAETCQGMEKNQNYCSHLIPLCILRCKQGNEYGFQLLQGLIYNNEHNIQLFYESDGHCLFSREFLKYGPCLQLLNTIIVKPNHRTKLLEDTNILHDLKDLKRLYGVSTEVGQWATIILYAIHSKGSVFIKDIRKDDTDSSDNQNNSVHETKNSPELQVKNFGNDTTELFQNVIREVLNFESKPKANRSQIREGLKIEPSPNGNRSKIREVLNLEPYRKPYRPRIREVLNIESSPKANRRRIKEVFNLGPQPKTNMSRINKTRNSLNTNTNRNFSEIKNGMMDISLISRNSNRDSLLGSCLKQGNLDTSSCIGNNTQGINFCSPEKRKGSTTNNLNIKETKRQNEHFSSYNNMVTNTIIHDTTMINFRPAVVSTPKRINKPSINRYNTSEISKRYSPINKTYKNRFKNRQMDAKFNSFKEKIDESVNDRQRSLGGRLLDAINESCTTLVRTVKNVFRTKRTETQIKDTIVSENENTDRTHCANSFMSFMRKRDAFLNEQNGNSNINSNREEYQNECVTCNDTLCMKQKFADDEFLKETVKRLKFGINLYGCDFKKISRTLWRHDSYMTPSLLYNLYRKLIVK